MDEEVLEPEVLSQFAELELVRQLAKIVDKGGKAFLGLQNVDAVHHQAMNWGARLPVRGAACHIVQDSLEKIEQDSHIAFLHPLLIIRRCESQFEKQLMRVKQFDAHEPEKAAYAGERIAVVMAMRKVHDRDACVALRIPCGRTQFYHDLVCECRRNGVSPQFRVIRLDIDNKTLRPRILSEFPDFPVFGYCCNLLMSPL